MRRPPVALAACIVALTGCGGGTGGGGGRAETVPRGGALRVVAREYSFDPGRALVAGGGRVRLVLRDAGSLPHNLNVEAGGRVLGGTPTIESGSTGTATLRLPRGRYELLCTVGDHAQLGMRGTLVVR
jgi:plastocyanin